MLLSGGEIFSDPLSEGKRRIVWVLFIVQKGVGERSNKCIECTRHVRFLPRGVFYYFMGGNYARVYGFHRMRIQRGSHFPCKWNLRRGYIGSLPQLNVFPRFAIIGRACFFFPLPFSFKNSEMEWKALSFRQSRRIYIYILSIGQI